MEKNTESIIMGCTGTTIGIHLGCCQGAYINQVTSIRTAYFYTISPTIKFINSNPIMCSLNRIGVVLLFGKIRVDVSGVRGKLMWPRKLWSLVCSAANSAKSWALFGSPYAKGYTVMLGSTACSEPSFCGSSHTILVA